jgi:phage terminase Nu1 subunit (DNA packaging protein)
MTELRYYQAADAQLKKIREAIKTLFSEKSDFSTEQIARQLAALLDLAPPSPP